MQDIDKIIAGDKFLQTLVARHKIIDTNEIHCSWYTINRKKRTK